ncbi:MAG: putative immunity protein [Lentimicrobiaceae bacterium]|jgi:hypothetical protein
MKKLDEEEHKLLTLWAADCAEHVLSLFELKHPDDERSRKAIEAARAWVLGELTTIRAREAAFAAHAAARDAINTESIAAARSAGHAAATAHVSDHAKYAAAYAIKASSDPKAEREWQLQKLPANIKSMIT